MARAEDYLHCDLSLQVMKYAFSREAYTASLGERGTCNDKTMTYSGEVQEASPQHINYDIVSTLC